MTRFTEEIQSLNEKTFRIKEIKDSLQRNHLPKQKAMKQKVMTLASLFILLIISSSCIFMGPPVKGNGNVVEEKRKAGKFDEIKVSRGMNVYISQGSENRILVKADENLLEFIETEVEGRALKISSSRSIGRATCARAGPTS